MKQMLFFEDFISKFESEGSPDWNISLGPHVALTATRLTGDKARSEVS